MATPLKQYFDDRVPRGLARAIARVWPAFRSRAFVADALDDYDDLELMDRGRHLARVLGRHLPDDYPTALGILLRSMGDRPPKAEGDGGMATFVYLPHVCFVAEFGLGHFDESMRALYLLTQRFTSEFAIRPFLERHEAATLCVLRQWTADANVHVRRLVSEGTRPRLPWAPRLRRFQQDPAPVVDLLERLKDDPEPFVRRSVANNLNDIGKDHPAVLVGVARRWLKNASAERRALVRHALRSLVKQGHPAALQSLGFGRAAAVRIENVRIAPRRVARGGRVTVTFSVRGAGRRVQPALLDLRVHFIKARGRASVKVFKLKTLRLSGAAATTCRKTISLGELTTRRHYPGRHLVELQVNGRVRPLGAFLVTA